MPDDDLNDAKVWSGHAEITLAGLARMQPGLARLMPEVGARTWKLYYAAKAENWPLARLQAKEAKKLLDLCMMTRPKYAENLNAFLRTHWEPILVAVEERDWRAFESAFDKAVRAGNAYHKLWQKAYIKWKLPSGPPPDLDLSPEED